MHILHYVHTYIRAEDVYLFITDDLLLSDFPNSGAMRANTGASTLATKVVSSRQSCYVYLFMCWVTALTYRQVLTTLGGTCCAVSRTKVLMDSSGCAMTLTNCGTNGRISSFEITATYPASTFIKDNMHIC